MQIFWARVASFDHLGLISDPLIVSKFHNEIHDPKGQENKIHTIVNTSILENLQMTLKWNIFILFSRIMELQ